MLESAIAALGHLASPLTFLALTGGVLIGMVSGAMPGGGVPGLVILLGFAYHMDPWIAIPLAIGMWSTVPTTDTIPAVLLGIPGSTSGQATIIDGHAMARKGQAGVALAAAYFGSLVGGLLGAIFLVLTLPIARPSGQSIWLGRVLHHGPGHHRGRRRAEQRRRVQRPCRGSAGTADLDDRLRYDQRHSASYLWTVVPVRRDSAGTR